MKAGENRDAVGVGRTSLLGNRMHQLIHFASDTQKFCGVALRDQRQGLVENRYFDGLAIQLTSLTDRCAPAVFRCVPEPARAPHEGC